MSRSRKIISASLIIIITLLIAGVIFFSLLPEQKSVISPLSGIPSDAALVMKVNDFDHILSQLTDESRIWNALLSVESLARINDNLLLLDSVSKQNELFRKKIYAKEFWLSVHPISASNIGLVLQIQGFKHITTRKILRFLEDIYPQINIRKIKLQQNTEYSLYRLEAELPYLIMGQGVLIFCNDFGLTQAVIRELHQDRGLKNDKGLAEIATTAGKKVEANIYVQPGQFQKILSYFLVSRSEESDLLLSFSDWIELDFTINDNEFLLNGYSLAGKDKVYFSDFIQEQQPGALLADEILPASTVRFLWYYNSKGLTQNKELYKLTGSFEMIPDSVTTSDTLMKIFRGEIAEAICEIYPNTQIFRKYLILQISDSAYNADSVVNHLHASKTLEFNSYPVYQTDLYGKSKSVQNPKVISSLYFTVIRNYVVFADEPTLLVFLIDNYINGNTLESSIGYRMIYDNIADESNFIYYVSLKYIFKRFRDEIKPEIISKFLENSSPLDGLNTFVAQFTKFQNRIYNNLLINYSGSNAESELSLWKFKAKAEIVSKPVITPSSLTDSIFLIVFDERSRLYAIDSNGKLIWDLQLKEPPLGKIHFVINQESNTRNILFNTSKYLYLIDAEGNVSYNYPVEFKIAASGPMELVKYDSRSEYRILIPTVDNKIQNVDLRGNPIEGWNYPSSQGKVSRNPQYIRHKGTDYLITIDNNGKAKITDRRGKTNVNADRNLVIAQNSKLYLNRTNDKGIFISTNPHGEVVYVTPDGRVEKTIFGQFSENHHFFYYDFDLDNKHDFVFFDNQELLVYNRFKKLIFSYNFRSRIDFPPELIITSKGHRMLVFISRAGQLLYIIDNDGNVKIEPIPVLTDRFTVASNGTKVRYLTATGAAVYQYILD